MTATYQRISRFKFEHGSAKGYGKMIPIVIARLVAVYALSPGHALLMEKLIAKPPSNLRRLAKEVHFKETAALPLIEMGGTPEQLERLLDAPMCKMGWDQVMRLQHHAANCGNVPMMTTLKPQKAWALNPGFLPETQLLTEAAKSGQLRVVSAALRLITDWTAEFERLARSGQCTKNILRMILHRSKTEFEGRSDGLWQMVRNRGRMELDPTRALTMLLIYCDESLIQLFMEKVPKSFRLIEAVIGALERVDDAPIKAEIRRKREFILGLVSKRDEAVTRNMLDIHGVRGVWEC
ncbi:MAG: hypothetical protein KGL39_01135 [Patescibacteria group bacterium]|nr:hypothetical protein [Patescibacteria group bacterium]